MSERQKGNFRQGIDWVNRKIGLTSLKGIELAEEREDREVTLPEGVIFLDDRRAKKAEEAEERMKVTLILPTSLVSEVARLSGIEGYK